MQSYAERLYVMLLHKSMRKEVASPPDKLGPHRERLSIIGIKRGEAPLRIPHPSPLHKGRGIKGEGLLVYNLIEAVCCHCYENTHIPNTSPSPGGRESEGGGSPSPNLSLDGRGIDITAA